MKQIVIVKTGSTVSVPEIAKFGDFDKWIISGTNADRNYFTTVSPFMNEKLPEPEDISGIIVTGSPTMVTEKQEWIGLTVLWLRKCFENKIPTLGICFGHQLIVLALNGEVDYRQTCMEIGTANINLKNNALDNPLFKNVPNEIKAHVVHSQSVTVLPKNAEIMAYNNDEPYHAMVADEHIWGLQFHPEFNENIIKAIISYYHDELIEDGIDTNKIINNVCNAEFGTVILNNFFNIVKTLSK